MIDLRDCLTLQLMPEVFRGDPAVQAASYALSVTAGMLLEKIDHTSVYAAVDILPEQVIDLLAAEFRAQYYDADMPVDRKRTAVKNALRWYEKAGTLKTVKELTDLVFGENIISEWFEHEGRPYTFWLEVMGFDVLITDRGMADFIAALQKVKNTRSLLDRIIFHRKTEAKAFSGAIPDSYSRQVIVDFFSEHHEDEFERHAGTHQENYLRQSITDHFTEGLYSECKMNAGSAPVVLSRQIIKEE